jgi:predicted membrane-bound spermidine synthase
MAKRRRAPRHLPVRTLHRQDGRLTLEVGGVVQSIAVPPAEASAPLSDPASDGPSGGYWDAMLPADCPRRALLLGLGGGTIAQLLARRCAGVRITGVERDETVLAVARAELGLDAIPGLTAVLADAFVWVPDAVEREPGRYDLICLDLFEAGRLALGTLATPFLRQLATLLSPGGILTVNLMVTRRTPEQLHRLERLFLQVHTIRVRGNVVVHLRARPPDQTTGGVGA